MVKPDLIGQELGGYRIIEQAGKGGMATVYKAFQSSLDRYVALKVMPPYYAQQDETFLRRFKREAQAIAKLRHPNILMVLDYGEENEITFIVMEYVDAGTLGDRLGAPLPLDEMTNLTSQIADALDYAHGQGVIHRDIKPSNILLPKPDWPLLTDFGLAKIVDGSQLTQSGMISGTPAYMSPEQGRGERVMQQSDIYSLGVVLYEMATGDVPFTSETPMSIVVKHIIDPLPLPRTRNPNLPLAVERVILKALAKDPADRYQTAGAMADDLKLAVVEGQNKAEAETAITPPIPSLGESPQDSSHPGNGVSPQATPVKKGRRGMRIAGVILGGLVLIAICGISLFAAASLFEEGASDPGNGSTLIAGAPLADQAAEGEAFLEGDDLGYLLGQANTFIENGEVEPAIEVLNTALELGSGQAWLHESVGWLYQDLGMYSEAIDQYDTALELDPEAEGAYFGLANAYTAMGQPALVVGRLEQAIKTSSNPDLYDLLGWQYMEMGDFHRAAKSFENAVSLSPGYVSSWIGWSDALAFQGNSTASIEVLERAMAENSNEAEFPIQLGRIFFDRGEMRLAQSSFEKAIDIDPRFGQAYLDLTELYRAEGNQAAALEILETALEEHPDLPELHEALGMLLIELERPEDAIAHLNEARTLNPGNPWLLLDLAKANILLAENEIALQLLDELMQSPSGDPWLMESAGWAFIEAGDCTTAIHSFEIALEIDPAMEHAQEGLDLCLEGN